METRLNPSIEMTTLAKDMKKFLKKCTFDAFEPILKSAKIIYEAPTKEWIKSWIYKRERVIDFITLQQSMMSNFNALQGVEYFFNKEKSGWKDTSANTTLLREILKEIPNYDQKIIQQIPLNDLIILKSLFLLLIKNQNEISKEKAILTQLHEEHKNLEEQINDNKSNLTLIKKEINTFIPKLDHISKEKIKFIMGEAKKLSEVAIRTYLMEYDEKQKKQQELESMHGLVSNAKQRLGGKNVGGAICAADSSKQIEQERLQRQSEVKNECQLRSVKATDKAKEKLNRFFTKKPPAVKPMVHIKKSKTKNASFLTAFSLMEGLYQPKKILKENEKTMLLRK